MTIPYRASIDTPSIYRDRDRDLRHRQRTRGDREKNTKRDFESTGFVCAKSPIGNGADVSVVEPLGFGGKEPQSRTVGALHGGPNGK